MHKWSILQYFRPSLSYHSSFRSLICLFFEWPLKTGFTVQTLKYISISISSGKRLKVLNNSMLRIRWYLKTSGKCSMQLTSHHIFNKESTRIRLNIFYCV